MLYIEDLTHFLSCDIVQRSKVRFMPHGLMTTAERAIKKGA